MSAFYPFLQVKQNGRRTGTQPDSTTPLADITHLVNDRFASTTALRKSIVMEFSLRRLPRISFPTLREFTALFLV
jgi:hypothetical protein